MVVVLLEGGLVDLGFVGQIGLYLVVLVFFFVVVFFLVVVVVVVLSVVDDSSVESSVVVSVSLNHVVDSVVLL